MHTIYYMGVLSTKLNILSNFYAVWYENRKQYNGQPVPDPIPLPAPRPACSSW